jgi:hypothetical protein
VAGGPGYLLGCGKQAELRGKWVGHAARRRRVHGAGGGGWRRTVWARRGRDNKNDVRLRGKWGERCSFWTGVAEELCQVGPAEFRNFPGICRPAEKGNDFGGENKIVPELQTSQEFLLI